MRAYKTVYFFLEYGIMEHMIKKFHNLPKDVKKSVADQIKLLSWVLSGVNGYFMHLFGNVVGVLSIIIWWVAFQIVAHNILYNIDKENGKE